MGLFSNFQYDQVIIPSHLLVENYVIPAIHPTRNHSALRYLGTYFGNGQRANCFCFRKRKYEMIFRSNQHLNNHTVTKSCIV